MSEARFSESDFLPHVCAARYFETPINFPKSSAPRRCEHFETSFYLTDSGTLFVNEEKYALKRNHVRFVRPGDIVHSCPPFRCMTIHFDANASEAENLHALSDIPRYFPVSEEVGRIFEKCIYLFNRPDTGTGLLLNSYALRLIYSLYSVSHREKKLIPSVKSSIEYMESHFSEKITLDTFGSLSGYAPLHFLRLFKQSVGTTPHAYLTDIRLRNAKMLLESTTLSTAEIAEKCGFESVSHFQVLFKKKTGVGAAKYRKEIDM